MPSVFEKESKHMKKWNLRQLIFLVLCCDIGLFSKRILSPLTHVVTDLLRVPDGIFTGFSLMFLIIAASIVERFGCATVMGAVQSALAMALGMVGAMGVLTPISYILPGLVIDCVLWCTGRFPMSYRMVAANILGGMSACLTANFLVMHLRGGLLWLYVGTGCLGGALFGLLGVKVRKLILPHIGAPAPRS